MKMRYNKSKSEFNTTLKRNIRPRHLKLSPIGDNFILSITHPADITYVSGTTDNNISWTVTDAGAATTDYTIYRDGASIVSDSWTSDAILTRSIDGLGVGTYNYTIVATDGLGGSIQDTVIVTVTTTTTPASIDGYPIAVVAIITFVAVPIVSKDRHRAKKVEI